MGQVLLWATRSLSLSVDNTELCALQSLALLIGREIFDITLQFFLCSLFFSLSLTHTHDFSLQGHYVGFVSVWRDRVEKIERSFTGSSLLF